MWRRSYLGCWRISRCDRRACDCLSVTAVMSNKRLTNKPPLDEGYAGLNRESVAMPHQLRTVFKQTLAKKLGRIDNPETLEALREAMRVQLDL